MFRAALFSIVLALAAGPNASLFCGVWCHSCVGMVGTCEHTVETGAAPGIVAADECPITDITVAFVREDARRSILVPNVDSATLVPRLAVTPPASGIGSVYHSGSRLQIELRPLRLSLRI